MKSTMIFTLLTNNSVTRTKQQSNSSDLIDINDITHKNLSLVESTYSLMATQISAFVKNTKPSTKSILSLYNNFSKKPGNTLYVRYFPYLFGRLS